MSNISSANKNHLHQQQQERMRANHTTVPVSSQKNTYMNTAAGFIPNEQIYQHYGINTQQPTAQMMMMTGQHSSPVSVDSANRSTGTPNNMVIGNSVPTSPQSLSFSPRLSTLLLETKNNMNLTDQQFLPILSVLDQGMVKTTNILYDITDSDLAQMGVPLIFARGMMRRFDRQYGSVSGNTSTNNTPANTSPASQVSSTSTPNAYGNQPSNTSPQANTTPNSNTNFLYHNTTNVVAPNNCGNSTGSSTSNVSSPINYHNLNQNLLYPQQMIFAQPAHPMQQPVANPIVLTNTQNQMANYNMVFSHQQPLQQNSQTTSNNTSLPREISSIPNNDLFIGSANNNDDAILNNSGGNSLNSFKFLSSTSSSTSFQDFLASTNSSLLLGVDGENHAHGSLTSHLGQGLNLPGSQGISVGSNSLGSLGSSMNSMGRQGSCHTPLTLHTPPLSHMPTSTSPNQQLVVNQGLTNRAPFESPISSSSGVITPGSDTHSPINRTHYGASNSNVLGVLSPQDDVDMTMACSDGSFAYKCRVISDNDGHKNWPKIATWTCVEGMAERDLFTVVISKDNPTSTKANERKKAPVVPQDGQDTLLDFRNKYMRISLTESGKDSLIKVEQVVGGDTWGFLTSDASLGLDVIEELRQLGFPESAYCISKQTMGFERIPTEQSGSIVIKRDDQLLLMKFPKYGTEQAKGIRKRKLLLVKHRFSHANNCYVFYTLFNLRKENSNAAMCREDIWISNLFIERDTPAVQQPVSKRNEKPITPEETSNDLAFNSPKNHKRTCDWEVAESENMQFVDNTPLGGRGGVDVTCKLDLIFDDGMGMNRGVTLKRKYVSDPSIESHMFLVETAQQYDFLEKGFFKVVKVTQHESHVDLVVKMPRPIRETTTPKTVYFHVLYNMRPILDNPYTTMQGQFTYEPIDKEELAVQFKEKIFEYYNMYGSQFEDDVKKSAAEKISKEIQNLPFSQFGTHEGVKEYSNLYVEFVERFYKHIEDEANMNEESFIRAVSEMRQDATDMYGFSLLTHYAFRGLKRHCKILVEKFGLSFEHRDNLGNTVTDWCRLAGNPNDIMELAYLENKPKTIVKHGVYTTTQPRIIENSTIPTSRSSTSLSSSPTNLSTSPPPKKVNWLTGLFKTLFTSQSVGELNFDEEPKNEADALKNVPIDVNTIPYDERLLTYDERQAVQMYTEKLRKLEDKFNNKFGKDTSLEKQQQWRDLYLDDDRVIETQNAVCKDRFIFRHFGKTMETISKKHKDEKKPPLLTVKIILSDCTGEYRNTLFNLFQPAYRDNLFGAFHTELLLGPWKISFYDHSIVRVRGDYRNFRNEFALAVFDVGAFQKVDQIKNALDTVASACVEWNGTKTYDPVKCNCQHFVIDVLRRLNLWQEKANSNFSLGPFERYLDDLRRGRSERRYYFTKSLKELKKTHPESQYWEKDYVTFNTRKELNNFCIWLDSIDYFEGEEGSQDFQLLKAFDRSFCFQNNGLEQTPSVVDNTVWYFSEDGTEYANSLNKLIFNIPGVMFTPPMRV